MKLKEVLEIGVKRLKEDNIEEPIFLARRLMCFVLQKDKVFLITNSESEVSEEQKEEFLKHIEQLAKNIPIQYILKEQEFMKMKFYVDENVLIPRQDTEIVVEEAIKIINKHNFKNILDMCTGSGAIAVSVAKYTECTNVHAVDISLKALEVAKMNANINNVGDRIEFIHSNIFENINEKYDLIISNPPYIKTEIIETLSEEVKKEPRLALDGGADGLIFYKSLANNAYKFLNAEGYLVLEIGYDQKAELTELLEYNYKDIKCLKDIGGNDRVIICKKR